MCKTTATNINNNFVATRYSYGNNDNEYVLSCKGRPFAVLVSPNLETPTSSLVDYDLVKSLGLKLTDLQCRKFSFAGNKFRILGRVTTAVQCVQHGRVGSTFHLKCDVVADLYRTLDTHCVASAKLQQHLVSGEVITIVDDEDKSCPQSSEAPPGPPAASTTPPPASAEPAPLAPRASAALPETTAQPPLAPSTPPRASAASPSAAAPSPRSPPGLPTTPQHVASPPITATKAETESTIPVRRVVDGLELSPFSANIRALSDTFQDADLQRDVDEQIWTLEDVDEDGYLDTNGHGGECMYTFTNGLWYSVDHGRHGCSRIKCPQSNLSKKKMFNNCGYHSQWHLPRGFTPCGDRCKGAFCFCLRKYHRQVCPDTASYQAHLRKVRLEEEEERKRRGRK